MACFLPLSLSSAPATLLVLAALPRDQDDSVTSLGCEIKPSLFHIASSPPAQLLPPE